MCAHSIQVQHMYSNIVLRMFDNSKTTLENTTMYCRVDNAHILSFFVKVDFFLFINFIFSSAAEQNCLTWTVLSTRRVIQYFIFSKNMSDDDKKPHD